MENQDLMKQFLKVDKMMHRYQGMRMQQFGPMGNPYRGQGRVLALLKMQPEITQKKLGFLLDMRTQSLGELLSKLEKQELITREPSAEDRRVMNVKLTESGKERAEEMNQTDQQSGELFDCLSDEEKEKLAELLNKVSGHLEELHQEQMKNFAEFDGPSREMPFGFGGGMDRSKADLHEWKNMHRRHRHFGFGGFHRDFE
ncbi:MarR family winged helix-turn-helix transcriptional regulator [Listeria aquatica]|uniref:MarR family winged helix-turn-helix transcriptional regulator n=1 Tax=Listeria aquatica TaxID=1494960 RepID=UPI0031F4D530